MPFPHLSFLGGLFIGIITVSEITLIPGVYLGYISGVPLVSIFVIALVAAATTDIFWYAIGYYFPAHKLLRFRIMQREKQRAQALQEFYKRHRLRMCFYCKFLHGTQIFFQIMAGGHRVPFFSYLAVSLLSTVTWFILAAAIGVTVSVTVSGNIDALKDLVIGIQIIASLTLLVGVISYLTVCRIIRRERTAESQ